MTGKAKMKFALIHSMADLKAGFHGIPEPESWCREIPKCGSKPFVIVPGVVFDRAETESTMAEDIMTHI